MSAYTFLSIVAGVIAFAFLVKPRSKKRARRFTNDGGDSEFVRRCSEFGWSRLAEREHGGYVYFISRRIV